MDRLLELINDDEKLVKLSTLFIGSAALITFSIPVHLLLLALKPTWKLRQLPFDFLLIFGWIVFWALKKYRLPKNTRRVGIFISLTTENDKEKIRVKNDMVRKFEELVVGDSLQDWVAIIVLNNYQAREINPLLKEYRAASLTPTRKVDAKLQKRWQKLRNSTNGNYYIFGHVSERGGSENAYFLNTSAIVAHHPLGEDVRQQLTLDFQHVWSNEVTFLEKIEKVGFDFTATYWYTGAKYMIGCAAIATNDILSALKLHEAVKTSLNVLRIMPTFAQTQKRLDVMLAAEHALIANTLRMEGNKDGMKTHLKACLAIDPKHYDGHLLRAIDEFESKEPQKALKTIIKISKSAGRNRTWMYSQAFLLMYMEQFTEALRVYRNIANYSFEGEIEFVIPQIILFNEGRIKEEPQKIQSHFILGYLKLKKRLNYPEALGHLETFLEKAKGQSKFAPVVKEAEACIRELEQRMR